MLVVSARNLYIFDHVGQAFSSRLPSPIVTQGPDLTVAITKYEPLHTGNANSIRGLVRAPGKKARHRQLGIPDRGRTRCPKQDWGLMAGVWDSSVGCCDKRVEWF